MFVLKVSASFSGARGAGCVRAPAERRTGCMAAAGSQ